VLTGTACPAQLFPDTFPGPVHRRVGRYRPGAGRSPQPKGVGDKPRSRGDGPLLAFPTDWRAEVLRGADGPATARKLWTWRSPGGHRQGRRGATKPHGQYPCPVRRCGPGYLMLAVCFGAGAPPSGLAAALPALRGLRQSEELSQQRLYRGRADGPFRTITAGQAARGRGPRDWRASEEQEVVMFEADW